MTKIRPSPARSEPVSDSTPCESQYDSAPTSPAAGRVISQATAIRPATAQRTSAPGLPTPLPRIEPGRHVGGRQRHARGAGAQDDRGRRCLGGEALRRLDLDQTLAERADDAPAADVGAEADGERAAEDDPERQAVLLHVAGQVAGGDERERDDAHRLLGVVGAVRQRDQRGGRDLAPAEALFAALLPSRCG